MPTFFKTFWLVVYIQLFLECPHAIFSFLRTWIQSTKVLEFIKDLFEVKAETKGVKIEYALTNDLYVPAISGKIDFREKFNENVSDND